MATDFGSVPAGITLPVLFESIDGAGASITISDFALADIRVYKDGGTTQRSSTSGFALLDTDGVDFDAITGIHGFSIDLSDDTDSGFYAVGSFFNVVVSAVTVNGQSRSFNAATFRIVAAESVTGYQPVDVAGVRSAVGLTSANLDTQLAAIASYIDTEIDSIISTLGSPANASLAADIAAVKSDTGAALTDTNELQGDLTDGGRLDLLFDAIKAKTDNLPASPAAVGSEMALTSDYDFAKGTVAMTEAYAANGVAPTPVQALFALHQRSMHFTIAGSTLSVLKLDDSSVAFEVTHDDATAPTSARRV